MSLTRLYRTFAFIFAISLSVDSVSAWPLRHAVKKTRVRFLATSTLIRNSWGPNEDTYFAELLFSKQGEAVPVRLVDAYPSEAPPLSRAALTSPAGTILRVRRDQGCDLPYSRLQSAFRSRRFNGDTASKAQLSTTSGPCASSRSHLAMLSGRAVITIHEYLELSGRCHGKSHQEGITAMQIENNKRHVQQSIGQRKGDRVMSRTLIQLSFCDGPCVSASAQTNTFPTSGNVGIGTTAPAYLLHLSKAGGNQLLLQSTSGGNGAPVDLSFQTYTTINNTVQQSGRIEALDDSNFSANMTFWTKTPGADTNSLVERMRVTSAGRVGIGTPNPGEMLDVFGEIVLGAVTERTSVGSGSARIQPEN